MKIIRKVSRFLGNKDSTETRDYYYEKLLNKFESIDPYLNLIKLQNKRGLSTNKDIVFSENPEFSKHKIKYIKKRYGRPNYTIVNNYGFGKIKIYFYRIYLGDHKVNMELHFYKNTLIMYNYTFSHLHNDVQKSEVINLLKQKYHIDKTIDLQDTNSYIIDQKNSIIVSSQDIDFTINYVLNINDKVFQDMSETQKREVEQGKQIPNHNKRQVFVNL
ncbi:hypothetical protein FCN74_05730 [Mesohalobacter halotolerans]|uniref:Uncharacterized protein n=2 Tax=Mesohalobacter halotolerans TaxID=1883405 RepID=A0A4V6XYA9_9FLAO|nr:hypothetical protein FCN74_05730 [Mesohalobacter halotolerans]